MASSFGMVRASARKSKTGRNYGTGDKSQINIYQMFERAIRCHICGGVVDLKASIQYDHIQDFALTGETNPDTGAPTHPFCNNHSHKHFIMQYRQGERGIELPEFLDIEDKKSAKRIKDQPEATLRLPFPEFWGEDNFPE